MCGILVEYKHESIKYPRILSGAEVPTYLP